MPTSVSTAEGKSRADSAEQSAIQGQSAIVRRVQIQGQKRWCRMTNVERKGLHDTIYGIGFGFCIGSLFHDEIYISGVAGLLIICLNAWSWRDSRKMRAE